MTRLPENGEERDVGELYRSVASEKAPERLDRYVLQRAEQAAMRDDAPSWLRWLRPATATAVVGIGLMLVAVRYDIWNLTPPTDGDADVVQDFGDAARDSSTRFREFGETVTPEVLNSDTFPADYQRDGTPLTSQYCREEQLAGRAEWEACISALQASGRLAEAAEERRKFRVFHP